MVPWCQVLPQLAEGLALAWEPLLAAVCSRWVELSAVAAHGPMMALFGRHVATIQDMILRRVEPSICTNFAPFCIERSLRCAKMCHGRNARRWPDKLALIYEALNTLVRMVRYIHAVPCMTPIHDSMIFNNIRFIRYDSTLDRIIFKHLFNHIQPSQSQTLISWEDREWTYQQMCSAACSLRDRLLEGGLCPSRGRP